MRWAKECCFRRFDPESGARITQLTSAADISNNIYGEQPYTSPDGSRVAILRKRDYCFQREGALLVCDLDGLRTAMVESQILGGVCTSAWTGILYYWTPQRELIRFSMSTLDREIIYVENDPKQGLQILSASPDQRYLIYNEGSGKIARLDLCAGRREVIFETEGLGNPHLQFTPGSGRYILVQQGRKTGTELLVIDADGKNARYIPAGGAVTAEPTGHECFVGDSDHVLFSVRWKNDPFGDEDGRTWDTTRRWAHDDRFPDGNILVASPGETIPNVFKAPEHKFNHVSVSRSGTLFVADSYTGDHLFDRGANRAVSIVVGNINTGKHRVLVGDTMASGGGNQCTHTHPYLTADDRHVIFNADPHYAPAQVFTARLTDDFLRSLI